MKSHTPIHYSGAPHARSHEGLTEVGFFYLIILPAKSCLQSQMVWITIVSSVIS